MIAISLTTNLILSLIFLTLNHPLSMGLVLLLQTVTISLITGNLNQNFWFSYILFLIMVGGMLILFMYMTSIASNEKFKLNLKMTIMFFLTPFLMWIMNPLINFYLKNNEIMTFNTTTDLSNSLNKYINMPLSMTLIFMMIYLLLVLIAIVKITNFKQGSIRQMN